MCKRALRKLFWVTTFPYVCRGQHIQWIHPNPTLHHPKMQMIPSAIAGAAYIPNNLPCRYRFPCGNSSLRHVGVPRGQARAVIQQNLITVAVVPAADQHRADSLLLQVATHRFAREVLAFQRLHFVAVGIVGTNCKVRPYNYNGSLQ